MGEKKLIIQKVSEEQYQEHSTRKQLYEGIEKRFGLPIISYFTSFSYPVMIEDNDAEMLEGLLQKCDLSKGFALLLSSPGGDGLAAERIINICRSYSGTGKYQVIIPGKAKSAATMICLGASKLIMSKTSELGSIEPQITFVEEGKNKRLSVYNLVESYDKLFKRAINEKKGNLEPYLQQLANYDEREIAEFRKMLSLGNDIATKALKSGMLSKMKKEDIEKKIKDFLTPEKVKVHGRPLYIQDAIDCEFTVEEIKLKEKTWLLIYELFVRLNNYVSNNNIAKCIECKDYSFGAPLITGE